MANELIIVQFWVRLNEFHKSIEIIEFNQQSFLRSLQELNYLLCVLFIPKAQYDLKSVEVILVRKLFFYFVLAKK